MPKTTTKVIVVSCSECGHVFTPKVTIKTGSEEKAKSEVDVTCPNCGTLLTVEVTGQLRRGSLHFRGTPKKS